MAKDYFDKDQCARCIYANWGFYEVYNKDLYDKFHILKLKAFCLTVFCFKQFKRKRKAQTDCKDFVDINTADLTTGRVIGSKHRTYKNAKVIALVKTEQISEFILPPMLETHGSIIRLLPNEDDSKHCGYVRSAKDTPFNRPTVEFYVEFRKDKFRKKYTMNKTTFRKCASIWGDDSDDWVNKELELKAVDQMVRGELRKVIYGEPLLPAEKPK